MKFISLTMLTAIILLTSCVGGTYTSKLYIKRDRFGESPVVDLRNMISHNELMSEEETR